MHSPPAPMPSALSPIAEPQRIVTLDIVRAVALFGVFLMNVEYFARPLQAAERMIEPGLHGLNHALAWFEYVFMHGKFWTMFALLFGMGFAVMLGRAQAQGRSFAAPYLRRTAALMAMGVAHAVLVWGGDILHSYAIAACVLLIALRGRWWWLLLPSLGFLLAQVFWGSSRPLFTAMIAFLMFAGAGAFLQEKPAAENGRRRFPYAKALSWLLAAAAVGFCALWIASPGFVPLAATVSASLLAAATAFLRPPGMSRLWRAGAAIYLILPLAISATILLGKLDASAPAPTAQAAHAAFAAVQAEAAQAASINAHGSYAENVALRWDYFTEMLSAGEVYLLISVMGMFLIGFWFVRADVIGNVQAHRGLFRRLAAFGVAVGAALALCSAAFYTGDDPAKRDQAFLAANLMTVANLLLSLGYVSALVLFIHGRDGLRLRWLAPAGRMALTNYLMQSAIGTLIFYGYGLGLSNRIDRIGQLALVIGVFALQVLASRWWMSRFHFGPAEWLWRAATYARWPPLFRRRASAPAITAESA